MSDVTLEGFGVLSAIALYVLAGLWYLAVDRPWFERALGRRFPSLLEPDVTKGIRFTLDAPRLTVAGLRALRTPSADPETERLRVLTIRRIRIVICLMPTIVIFPALAVLTHAALAMGMNIGVIGLAVVVGQCALFVRCAGVAAHESYRYGNGASLAAGHLWSAAGGMVTAATFMLAEVLIFAR